MIIVDTNVLAEPLRLVPDSRVVEWLDAQAVQTLFLTTISLAELRFGVAALPTGRRRDLLNDRLEKTVLPMFDRRVLQFDEPASREYAELRARARAAGRAIGEFDALIAAIARHRDFAVATRDTAPFDAAGVAVIDPFSGPAR